MALTTVLLKRSGVAGKVPLTSDLTWGEVSINYADGVLWYKTTANTISRVNAAVNGTTVNGVAYLGTANVLVNSAGLLFNPTGNVLTVAGNIVAASSTVSTSTTTGALVVTGGMGVGGALYIQNTGDVSANIGVLLSGNTSVNANLGAYQTYANTQINTVNANLGAYQTFANSNAATQQTSINSINANLGAYQTFANANVSSLQNQIFGSNANIGSYQTFANANVSSLQNQIFGSNANIGAYQTYANTQINSVNANLGAYQTYANTQINSINANLGAYQTFANSNAATQQTSIDTINANLGAYQTFANANAATQQTSLNTINANLGAYQTFANANVSSLQNQIFASNANIGAFQTYTNASFVSVTITNGINANLGAYQTFANANVSGLQNQIFASNANIGSYQSYANTQINSINANLGAYQTFANSNAATQQTSINSINANLGAYQTFANANVSSLQNQIFGSNANIGSYQTYANTQINTVNANIGAFQAYANTKIGTNSDSNLVVISSTASTNTTSGALVVPNGGVGIGGSLYVGGIINGSANLAVGNFSNGISPAIHVLSGNVVIGSFGAQATKNAILTLNRGNAAVGAWNGSTGPAILHMSGNALQNVDTVLDSYGFNVSSNFVGRHARGVVGAPIAVGFNDCLSSLLASGYGSTTWQTGGVLSLPGISFHSTEPWTDSAQGVKCDIRTTNNQTNVAVISMVIDNNGNVVIPKATNALSELTGALVLGGGIGMGGGVYSIGNNYFLGNFTNVGNLSTANAVISGGYITSLTNASITSATIQSLSATTIGVSNISTSNIVISGGYIISLANASITTIKSDNYQYANGQPFVSTTLANTSDITANLTSGQNVGLSLSTTGVTAGNYGSATAIPTIVVDAKGRITSLTTNAVSTTVSLAGNTGSGSVSGGGTLRVGGTPNQITTSVTGNVITVGLAANITTPGDLTVTGNLAVLGQSSVIGSQDLTVQDSIINLHTFANLAPLTTDDGRDIGLKFHYYKTSDSHAFLGWEDATGYLEWWDSGVEGTGNVFTGTTRGTIKAGQLILANSTAAISTASGALQVAGGAGIAGDVYTYRVNSTYANVLTSAYFGSLNTANAVITGGYVQNLANISAGTGTIATLNTTNANIQSSLYAGSISTGNAVITGGYVNNLANLTATTTQTTNFSTANAVITGGYADNFPIGANTAAPGRFTTLNTTSDAAIVGNLVVGVPACTSLHQIKGNLLLGLGDVQDSADSALTINLENCVPLVSNAAVHLSGKNGVAAIYGADAFGTGVAAQFSGRKARGTVQSPQPVRTDDIIASFIGRGFGNTQFTTGGVGNPGPGVHIVARENFTDSNYGTEIAFYTVPNGSTTSVESAVIDHTGNLVLKSNARSTSFLTGGLVLVGNTGLGVGGNIHVSQNITANVITSSNNAFFNGQVTVTGNLTVQNQSLNTTGNLYLSSNVHLQGPLRAYNGSPGNSGQVLVSTGTGTQWINSNSLQVAGGSLVSLTDVNIQNPAVQEVLTYNGTQWVNAASNATVASAIFATSQSDLGYVYDAVLTISEDEGLVTDVAYNIYDLGVLSFTGIIGLNNIDQSIKSDYLGYSIIFGF